MSLKLNKFKLGHSARPWWHYGGGTTVSEAIQDAQAEGKVKHVRGGSTPQLSWPSWETPHRFVNPLCHSTLRVPLVNYLLPSTDKRLLTAGPS
ncbi:hypothetical protein GN956_G24782 [Arapaima gigas]